MALNPAPDSVPVSRVTSFGRGRSWMPFWLLQIAEIVVAMVFVDISIHVHNAGLLLVAAFLFFALTITARGPLGIFRLCSQQLHVLTTMLIAVAVAIGPVLPVLRPDIEGIIVVEFGAVGLIRLCTLTRTGATTRPLPPVIDATASVTDSRTGTPAPAPGGASRGVAGTVAATGTRAAARYGPEARAQVKRGIKGAGRMAGRASEFRRER